MLLPYGKGLGHLCNLDALCHNYVFMEPVAVAQWVGHQTGDQEVASLIPAGSSNVLSWRFSLVIFSLPLTD